VGGMLGNRCGGKQVLIDRKAIFCSHQSFLPTTRSCKEPFLASLRERVGKAKSIYAGTTKSSGQDMFALMVSVFL